MEPFLPHRIMESLGVQGLPELHSLSLESLTGIVPSWQLEQMEPCSHQQMEPHGLQGHLVLQKYLYEITYGSSTFMAVGQTGTILTSSDGTSWDNRTSGTTKNLKGVTHDGVGLFRDGLVNQEPFLTSPDNGSTWTSRTSGTSNGLNGVINRNNAFVVVGDSGTILTSSGAATWTSRTSGSSNNLTGITYGNSTFVAVGANGTMLTSTDNTSWTTTGSGISKHTLGSHIRKKCFRGGGANRDHSNLF